MIWDRDCQHLSGVSCCYRLKPTARKGLGEEVWMAGECRRERIQEPVRIPECLEKLELHPFESKKEGRGKVWSPFSLCK